MLDALFDLGKRTHTRAYRQGIPTTLLGKTGSVGPLRGAQVEFHLQHLPFDLGKQVYSWH
jgi:hypothetical protein